jgi:hypothetical protein
LGDLLRTTGGCGEDCDDDCCAASRKNWHELARTKSVCWSTQVDRRERAGPSAAPAGSEDAPAPVA